MRQFLSVLMIVRNEEERIEGALRSIKPFCDEIVVIDQESTDNTFDLAFSIADHVIEHPNYGFSEASRAKGIQACTGDWVLILDADERMTNVGAFSLRHWVNNLHIDYYNLRRRTVIGFEVVEDMLHPRLFRKGSVISPSTIHTPCQPVPGARVYSVSADVIINHTKTWQEQRLDDMRYEMLKQQEYNYGDQD